jgi:hypothetical protein
MVYMGTKPSLLNIKRIIFYIIPCLLLLITDSQAASYSRDIAFRGYYKCSFSGIPFAKVGIHTEQDARNYSATTDILLTGVVSLFTSHSSHSTVDGSGKDYTYNASEYETNYKTKKKKRYVKLNYKGDIFDKETLVPPENPAKRTPVPTQEKNGSYDPLSALLKARMLLIDALEKNKKTFSLNVYDGRRLTKVDFTVLSTRTIRIDGKKVPIVAVQAKRTLIAGFTKSELADHDPQEPPMIMYFSNDEKLFPVRLQANLSFGRLTADLYKTCNAQESCLLGNKE